MPYMTEKEMKEMKEMKELMARRLPVPRHSLRSTYSYKPMVSLFTGCGAARFSNITVRTQLDDLSEALGPNLNPDVKAILDQMEASLASQGEILKAAVSGPGLGYQILPTPRSADLALTVFGTTELLENILSFLHPEDLIEAYSVCRQWYEVLQGSLILKRTLGLEPDYDCPLLFPLSSYGKDLYPRKISTSTRRNTDVDGDPDETFVDEKFGIDWKKPHFGILGTRRRTMLIAQPPVQTATVKVTCCDLELDVSAQTGCPGLTWGDLDDACRRILPAHLMCPNAGPHKHDDHGLVDTGLEFRFRAALSEKQKNRRLVEVKEDTKFSKDSLTRSIARNNKMEGYVIAKQEARAAGRAIPTYPEYLKQGF